MLSSAVKVLVLGLAGIGPQNSRLPMPNLLGARPRLVQGIGQRTSRRDPVFQKLRPAIATFADGVGQAVLIGPNGLFVAHRSVVHANDLEAFAYDGSPLHFHKIGQDGCTQLVLLLAREWGDNPTKPINAPSRELEPGNALIVVLPSGAVRGVFTSGDQVGVLRPSNRIVPLSELRFEAPIEACGGALVFTEAGEFVGGLSATLARSESGASSEYESFAQSLKSTRDQNPINRFLPESPLLPKAGPAPMTVAFTAGIDSVRRVVEGFRSPAHDVEHPSLGISCKNEIGGGALIVSVEADSPAEQAKLQPGDVIVNLAGYLIRNQVDFAKVMLRQHIGQKITMHLRRKNTTIIQDAIVGKATD